MVKKEMTYTDYNGVERTETFHFNLSKAEVTEKELSTSGGLFQLLDKITKEKDQTKIITIFKEIILWAYGEKSADGKHFIKRDELTEAFTHTEAYSDLFMELAFDAEAAAAFINGIIPADLDATLQAKINKVIPKNTNN